MNISIIRHSDIQSHFVSMNTTPGIHMSDDFVTEVEKSTIRFKDPHSTLKPKFKSKS